MGIRTRTVRQTITEVICDLCKKPVDESSAHVGTLAVKQSGVRGRARELQVAFHEPCIRRLASSAVTGPAARKAAKRPARTAAQKEAPARSKGGRRRAKRAPKKATAETS